MCRRLIFAVFFFSAAILLAQDDPLWQYIHPKAQALAGVEWKRVASSEVGQIIRSQFAQSAALSFPGTELLDSIDRILISSPGGPRKSAKSDTPAVLAIAGRFKLEAVRNAMAKGSTTARYHGTEILTPPRPASGENMELALLSNELILLGDRPSLRAVLDAPRAARAGSLFTRAAAMAADNDVWAVLAISPEALAGDTMPQAKAFKDVRGLEIGVSFRQGFALSMNLQATSAQKATEMTQAISGLIALASMHSGDQVQMQDLARMLRIESRGTAVMLAMSLTVDEVRQGLKSAAPTIAAATTRTAPVAKPDTPAKPIMIRIEGMQGGPVEIPMEQRQR